MTFSIVARAADGPSGSPAWGVAVASKFLAVGNAVPAAVAGIGAIATQAYANVAWKGVALAHLDEGATADITVQRLVEEDEGRDHRQVAVVDADGGAATYTGTACLAWAGGVTGDGYAIQGNILTGPEVVEAVRAAWEGSDPADPLAHRLLAALRAGDEAGGDKRGRQSAALLVVQEGSGYGGFDDVMVDLRVDDHTAPIPELERLLALHDQLNPVVAEEDRVPDSPELSAELDGRARTLGFDDFLSWLGAYNLEGYGDLDWTARQVIDRLREETPGWRGDPA